MSRTLKRLLLTGVVLAAVAPAGVFAWGEYCLRSARARLEEHQPRPARRHLDRCRWLSGGRSEFKLLSGRASRMLNEYDQAEQFLTECQRLEGTPSEETTLEWAMLRAQRGEMEPVEQFLRKQVDQKHPQSILILEAMTLGYIRLYRRLDAMNCLRQWLEQRPDHPRALFLRGQVYFRANVFSRAVDDLLRVVEAEPENDDARFLLAKALIENSQAPDAVPHLERLRSRRPDDTDVLVKLAFAWNMAGRIEESLGLLEQVLAENPKLGPALSARGQLELQRNDPEAAERWLREALKSTPSDRQTHYALYQALQQQGKDREAEAQQERLKKLEANIGRMLEITNRLLPLRPRDAKLAHELGMLMKEMGYVEVATGWFQKAIEYEPTFVAAHRELAEYYEKQGNAPAAAYHRERAGGEPRP